MNSPPEWSSWTIPPVQARNDGRNGTGRVRLFLFPYAGGGASMFRGWQAHFPDSVSVHAVQYPGRESRWGEPARHTLYQLVSELADGLASSAECGPFALAGHSFGALVAFEVARRLVRTPGAPVPRHLFLSAARPPQLAGGRPSKIHHLCDEQFLKALSVFGVVPAEIQSRREYLDLYLPILRNDFRLYEQHACVRDVAPLPIPVTVLGGVADPKVSPREMLCWQELVSTPITARFFPGGHFFLFDYREEITRLMCEKLLTEDRTAAAVVVSPEHFLIEG